LKGEQAGCGVENLYFQHVEIMGEYTHFCVYVTTSNLLHLDPFPAFLMIHAGNGLEDEAIIILMLTE
jgi:hypothetical protein